MYKRRKKSAETLDTLGTSKTNEENMNLISDDHLGKARGQNALWKKCSCTKCQQKKSETQ